MSEAQCQNCLLHHTIYRSHCARYNDRTQCEQFSKDEPNTRTERDGQTNCDNCQYSSNITNPVDVDWCYINGRKISPTYCCERYKRHVKSSTPPQPNRKLKVWYIRLSSMSMGLLDWVKLERNGWRVFWGGMAFCHNAQSLQYRDGHTMCRSFVDCVGHPAQLTLGDAVWANAAYETDRASKEFDSIEHAIANWEAVTGYDASLMSRGSALHKFEWSDYNNLTVAKSIRGEEIKKYRRSRTSPYQLPIAVLKPKPKPKLLTTTDIRFKHVIETCQDNKKKDDKNDDEDDFSGLGALFD